MKNQSKFFTLVGLFIVFMSAPAWCQYQKLAQTGMKFLNIATDARVSALGSAFTSVEGNASSMFFNPSGMANLPGFASVSLGQVNWIADIKYVYGSAAFNPANGRYGVFGLTAVSADYGLFRGTIRDAGESGYQDTGTFSPGALAIGIGYAKALSNKFSVGGNMKYVSQDLGTSIVGFGDNNSRKTKDYQADVLAYDLGILYHTGYKSLNFGMAVRNFSQEVRYEDEGFQLPLTFKIGLSMNMFEIYQGFHRDWHSLLLSVDAVHPRDYAEQLNIGAEYLFMKTFALRVGYSSPNDEHGLSLGLGLQQAYRNYQLAIDYAYTPFEIFDDVHRFSLHFMF